jgi:hypothetical protein
LLITFLIENKIKDLQKKIADALNDCEAQLTIQCVEVPKHNRLQTGRLTALDAANTEHRGI